MQESSKKQPKSKTAEEALATLQWICSKMERCESDVRRSLYRWHVPREQWDEVIAKLTSYKFVDNGRYAACYVRSKLSNSGWGATKIVAALRTKGIDREIIDQVMQEYVKPDQMQDKLEEFIRRRVERDRARSRSEYDLRVRVFRAAASRGFEFEQINSIINKYIKDEE